MGQPGGLAHKPGGSSLVQDATRRGASDAPGKRTLVEQAPIGTGARSGTAAPPGGAAAGTGPSLHLDRDPPKQGSGPAPGAGAGGLGDWVGAGKAGKVFQNATAEAFADGATKDALEIRTGWTLAEFASYELGTDAVMEVERPAQVGPVTEARHFRRRLQLGRVRREHASLTTSPYPITQGPSNSVKRVPLRSGGARSLSSLTEATASRPTSGESQNSMRSVHFP